MFQSPYPVGLQRIALAGPPYHVKSYAPWELLPLWKQFIQRKFTRRKSTGSSQISLLISGVSWFEKDEGRTTLPLFFPSLRKLVNPIHIIITEEPPS